MTKKTYNLVATCVASVAAIASGIVTYVGPEYTTAINASIPLAEGAILAICSNFTEKD